MPGAAEEQTDQVGESEQFKTGSTNNKRRRKLKSLGDTSFGDSMNKDRMEGSKRRKGPHKNKSSKQQFLIRCQDEDPQLVSTSGNGKHDQGIRRRRKQKRPRNSVDLDEPSRLKKRTRYLLIRMKVEQNLLDAYSTEGWKGQSREKIRPEKELQRAEKQILNCKLGLRDAIRQLDLLGSVGCIEDSAIAPDGSVHHEHIHCAKCKLRDAFPDNDIILCDGTCNCAFHQQCIDPPLLTENIPPGDQGWFCKFCECKMDIIETINAHLGTNFSEDSMWQDIFVEEAALPDGGHSSLHPEQDWPSDDSEDDDYDPEGQERCENSCDHSRGGSDADADADASDGASSSSSLWSLEDETFTEPGRSKRGSPGLQISSSCENSDNEVVSGRRQRRAVDYQKLYDEMFGKDVPANEQISEDEDWGPTKRKRREKESADAASTLMTLCETEERCADANTNEVTECSNRETTKRSLFRIPAPAVEKLRLAFAENELPSRDVKENLSKQLGLDPEKVSKWFKNARYLALKTRKGESENQTETVSPIISKEPESRVEMEKMADQIIGKDSSPANVIDAPKRSKFRRRKRSKSVASASKEHKHERASFSSPPVDNKAEKESGDNVSLKRMRKKAKKEKRRVVSDANGPMIRVQEPEAEPEPEPEAEAEAEAKPEVVSEATLLAEAIMVKLCKALDKIDDMKRVLQRLPCFQNESTPLKRNVMYVPVVVEVKEKA